MKRILTELRFEGNGYFYLYDANGVCLAHPIRQEWVGKNLLDHRDAGLAIVGAGLRAGPVRPPWPFTAY